MSLRQKVPVIIAIALLGSIAILYGSSQIILGASFGVLEDQATRQDLLRALDALSSDLSALNSKTGDWANWDDAYSFIQGDNPTFIKTNPTDTSFLQLRINLMLFIQPSGEIFFSKAFDLENKTETPIPPSLQKYFADSRASRLLLQNSNPEGSLTGLVLLDEGPMLIAARPILTSEGTGPIHGTLIFGRYLDAAEITRLAETTHLSLVIHRLDDPQMPADFNSARPALSEKTPFFVQTLSETSIAGYALLNDVYGDPALALRMDSPRGIYQEGQAAIRYFVLWLGAAGLVFALTTQWILQKLILSRRERQESEERYRAVIEQASEGIFLLDAKTKRPLEANKAFRNLLGYTAEEILTGSIYELIADDRENIEQDFQRVVTTRHHIIGERRYRHQDGSLLDTESSASLISYGGRTVICAVVRDVSERKRAEAERTRLFEQEQTRREELATLYALSRALADTVEFDVILNLVTHHAVETLYITFARVLLIEGTELVLRAAYPIRLLGRDLQVGRRGQVSEYPYCQRILTQDAPVVLRADSPDIDEYEHAMLFLYIARTLCLVPLRARERVFGLLLLGEERHEDREPFTPEKIRLARSVGEQAASALHRGELFAELERAYFQTALALANAVEAKDTYTADHAQRLAEMAFAIGQALGMNKQELEELRYGAILHDIGKIGIPDVILKKPAKLDEEEWKMMRQHPVIGERILAPVPHLAGAARIVRHHHERYDGTGYPEGWAGETIPLGARILTVVDAYSAILDRRVYKAARPHADAVKELQEHSGTQFDPHIVKLFLQIIARGKEKEACAV